MTRQPPVELELAALILQAGRSLGMLEAHALVRPSLREELVAAERELIETALRPVSPEVADLARHELERIRVATGPRRDVDVVELEA